MPKLHTCFQAHRSGGLQTNFDCLVTFNVWQNLDTETFLRFISIRKAAATATRIKHCWSPTGTPSHIYACFSPLSQDSHHNVAERIPRVQLRYVTNVQHKKSLMQGRFVGLTY